MNINKMAGSVNDPS